ILVGLIFFMVLVKQFPMGGTIPCKTFMRMILALICLSIKQAHRPPELRVLSYMRRLEATFYRSVSHNQLFDLIGRFLIHNDSQLDEINELKWMIENFCEEHTNIEAQSKEELVSSNNNQIMYMIWKLLSQYSDRFERDNSN